MRLGIAAFVNDQTPSVVEVAREVEARGFESLWLGEHTHMPVATTHPATRDGRLPDIYRRFPDPYVLLGAAAAATERLRLGVCVALVAEHNPLVLAKQVATLDHVSGGRVELGVGYGWNELEQRNNGVDPRRRRAVLREKLDAIRLLWTSESAAYDGEFVSFTESWSWPKPVQQPHPPLLLGARLTANALTDIAELCTGWLPLKETVADSLEADVARLREQVPSARVTVHDPEGSMGGKRSLAEFERRRPTAADLDRYAAAGVDRLILGVPAHDRTLLLHALDSLATLLP